MFNYNTLWTIFNVIITTNLLWKTKREGEKERIKWEGFMLFNLNIPLKIHITCTNKWQPFNILFQQRFFFFEFLLDRELQCHDPDSLPPPPNAWHHFPTANHDVCKSQLVPKSITYFLQQIFVPFSSFLI